MLTSLGAGAFGTTLAHTSPYGAEALPPTQDGHAGAGAQVQEEAVMLWIRSVVWQTTRHAKRAYMSGPWVGRA